MIKEDNEEKEPTFSQKVVPWIVASFVLFLVLLTKVFIDTLLGLRFGGGAILQSLFTTVCIGLWCIIFYCPFFKINKTRKRQNKFETSVKLSALPVVFFVIFFMAQVTDERKNTVEDTSIESQKTDNTSTDYKEDTTTCVINSPDIKVAKFMLPNNDTKMVTKLWISALEGSETLLFTGSYNDNGLFSAVFVSISGVPYLMLNVFANIEDGRYHGEIIIDGNVHHVFLEKIDNDGNNFIILPDGFSSTKQLYTLMARGDTMQINMLAGNKAIFTTFSLHGFTAALKRVVSLIKK